ncbi:MAG: hypothetical protein J4452_00235 [Candidatus Aenigmarchaeota archaeon]|nr:hypothetical protein [Candidatus Aenigmarchaeota archaeon]
MDKKLRSFLYPDWRKLTIFLIVILFFSFLWIQILVNSLPIMIIGTNEFQQAFCDIKLTAANCYLNANEIYNKESQLNQTVDELNAKYDRFSKFNSNFDYARMFIPSGAMACILDNDVSSLVVQNSVSTNLNILGMTNSCNSADVGMLVLNLVLLYLIICVVFWFFDKKK